MAARKVIAKKSASKAPAKRVVKDAEIDPDANTEAIESKDAGGKPKIHAKVVTIMFSVGTEDRNRSFEDFVEDIQKKIGVVPRVKNGKRAPGIHATATGGYYILDGKVCRPEDYDKKKGTFKKGAVPPTWAGGPKKTPLTGIGGNQMHEDAKNLSSDAYDRKYGLGKYKPENKAKLITPAMQKEMLEEWKLKKAREKDAELEEFDWDESDVEDTEKLVKEADASASRAIKALKSSSKKRVVKKKSPAPAQKKTVRRVKK
jgi:hypothetical protein